MLKTILFRKEETQTPICLTNQLIVRNSTLRTFQRTNKRCRIILLPTLQRYLEKTTTRCMRWRTRTKSLQTSPSSCSSLSRISSSKTIPSHLMVLKQTFVFLKSLNSMWFLSLTSPISKDKWVFITLRRSQSKLRWLMILTLSKCSRNIRQQPWIGT
jgi:hypothetical protein